jgi:hypothetical protein
MAAVIELDTDIPFDPSQWIRANRIYENVPARVSDAFCAVRDMPSSLKNSP